MNDAPSHSLEELIQRYDHELRFVLYRRIGCLDTVADILQETYRRMVARGLAAGARRPRALLHRIAANLATDHERAEKVRSRHLRSHALAETIVCPLPLPDRAVEAAGRFALLVRTVERLPPRCREVFLLRNFEELSQAEIAERLGITQNMVERHLRSALQLCRAELVRAGA